MLLVLKSAFLLSLFSENNCWIVKMLLALERRVLTLLGPKGEGILGPPKVLTITNST